MLFWSKVLVHQKLQRMVSLLQRALNSRTGWRIWVQAWWNRLLMRLMMSLEMVSF